MNRADRIREAAKNDEVEGTFMSPGERAFAAFLHNMEVHAMLHGYKGTLISDEKLQEALGHLEAVNYIIRDAAHQAEAYLSHVEG